MTLSGEKTSFGVKEILVVGHQCSEYGHIPNVEKVETIRQMRHCKSIIEVRRFLGACVFYNQWIPHYAIVVEPLYNLLRKGKCFAWTNACAVAMDALKEALSSAPLLRPLVYGQGQLIILTIDASPFAAGWALSQFKMALKGKGIRPGLVPRHFMRGNGVTHRQSMNYGVQSVPSIRKEIIL